MLRFEWVFKEVDSVEDIFDMAALWNQSNPSAAAFDTETTGLHIIHDKPFLYQCGWVDEETDKGQVFIFDISTHSEYIVNLFFNVWHNCVKNAKHFLGHNIKFDLHMVANIGYPYTGDNVDDTTFYIRLGNNAVQQKDGGVPMKLKDYAAQFITSKAKMHEKILKEERATQAAQYNSILISRLNRVGVQRWSKKRLDEVFVKDAVADYTVLSYEEQQAYLDWRSCDLPIYLQHVHKIVEPDDISYAKLNRKNVKLYAGFDIVYTLEIFYSLKDIVETRGNTQAILYERRIIRPLYDMERVGFKIDVAYMQQAEQSVKNYIIECRSKLELLIGQQLRVGQHAKLKEVIEKKLNAPINSTCKEDLIQIRVQLIREHRADEVVQIIGLINELRTLEKWYSTYIIRFIKALHKEDRIYTQINQVGTVSGRVTSDFQQFPKKGIQTSEGVHLFSPRKAVIVSGGDYDGIVYLDYSQIELRFQALYTILVGHPDLNLCRAYMPYKCCTQQGVYFDPRNTEHIKQAYTTEWFKEEDGKPWTPTDVHGATTEKAFDITPEDPSFHDLRYVGKRVNFAKNYGAKYNKIYEMFPEFDEERVHKIDDAYYAAFPGVKRYHEYCYELAKAQAYATNLFGVKYWGVTGHKLINMLVQGSAAYFLKWKIYEIWKYSKDNDVKSKFQMNIHDELSWEKHKDDTEIFTIFQNIMQDWADGPVPIVADMELTASTWEAKEEVKYVK